MAIKQIIGTLACAGVMALASSLPAAAADAIYKVTGISAYLYYDSTGKFDTRDLMLVKSGALYNTSIGEGMAAAPSNATLLMVELSGPSFAIKDVGKLNIKAETMRDGGKGPVKTVIYQQSVDVANFFQDQGTKIKIPFLMYDTGSGPITITATLQGGKDAKGMNSVLSKTIPFTGGE